MSAIARLEAWKRNAPADERRYYLLAHTTAGYKVELTIYRLVTRPKRPGKFAKFRASGLGRSTSDYLEAFDSALVDLANYGEMRIEIQKAQMERDAK
jgi:hypothetical protein